MFRTFQAGWAVPAVIAALLWATGPALARGPHGGGGGFHGGHGGGGFHTAHVGGGGFHGGHVGTWHGGHVAGYHGGHVGAWHGGHVGGWDHHGWGHGGWGSYGYGAYPYYYGSGVTPYYYPYNSYQGSTYYYTQPDYSYPDVTPYVAAPQTYDYSSTTQDYSVPATPAAPSTTTDTTAHIDVRVPDNAEVWVEGVKTQQSGTLRHFVSPPLTPGQDFSYDIRARWTDANGQAVDLTRHVQIHAGSQVLENFMAPAPGGE